MALNERGLAASHFLQVAGELLEERGSTYDKTGAERSMEAVVELFNTTTGRAITEVDGWRFMIALKTVRGRANGFHTDSYYDLVAYTALMAEAASQEAATAAAATATAASAAERAAAMWAAERAAATAAAWAAAAAPTLPTQRDALINDWERARETRSGEIQLIDAEGKEMTQLIGKYVIVRCSDAGVHAGVLQSRSGRECYLTESRRLWLWANASGQKYLSGLATHGLGEGSKIGNVVDILLTENCEIIATTAVAEASIRGIKSDES